MISKMRFNKSLQMDKNIWSYSNILKRLLKYKIRGFQLDPNGVCDNKCWYCPNKYTKIDKKYKVTMSLDVMESILKQLSVRDNFLVYPHLVHVFTAHYNEVLLYEHFEEMLALFEKYRFYLPLLTNGVPLTPDKIDIIKKYEKVVLGVHVNMPAGNAEDYHRYTGRSEDSFNQLVDNIKYFQNVFPGNPHKNKMTMVNNGMNDDYPEHRSYFMGGLDIPLYDLQKQNKQLKDLFPNINVMMAGGMNDRCGILKDFNIIDNTPLYPQDDEEIIGCGLSEDGGRMFSWVSINANGDMFLCCNDYHMDYHFGNVKNNSIKDIWYGDEHIKVIQRAIDGICKKCWITEKKKKQEK